MKQDEVESQLSAMFDGELPAAECELLSRRIDRDENLRARWSRYALIGAAMRSEPVATARSGFAMRVSAALEANARPRRLRRGPQLFWNGALAATLVAGVAGLGVSMLRTAALGTSGMPVAAAPVAVPAARPERAPAAALPVASHGPGSYVTPAGTPGAATILRTQLADYIVAHSAYSTPLLRRNVLSELVTSEDQTAAGAAGDAQGTAAGGGDAIRPASVLSR
ncbi:MAG TPA: sigma-E factor negative regulatory protein [Steroidobacteraceae bacterium]|nr:sigma-E factor negative regulatory protein [Steroidobacteraceae bacterium]